MKFFVGRKYKRTDCTSKPVLCIAINKHGVPVFEDHKGICWATRWPELYAEAIEPIVDSIWVNVYYNKQKNKIVFGGMWPTKETAIEKNLLFNGESQKYIDTIEVKYEYTPKTE